jgi:hypothetical protein
MNGGEWDATIRGMQSEELREYAKSLEILGQWQALKKEFGWTGLWVIGAMLDNEITRRALSEILKR